MNKKPRNPDTSIPYLHAKLNGANSSIGRLSQHISALNRHIDLLTNTLEIYADAVNWEKREIDGAVYDHWAFKNVPGWASAQIVLNQDRPKKPAAPRFRNPPDHLGESGESVNP